MRSDMGNINESTKIDIGNVSNIVYTKAIEAIQNGMTEKEVLDLLNSRVSQITKEYETILKKNENKNN